MSDERTKFVVPLPEELQVSPTSESFVARVLRGEKLTDEERETFRLQSEARHQMCESSLREFRALSARLLESGIAPTAVAAGLMDASALLAIEQKFGHPDADAEELEGNFLWSAQSRWRQMNGKKLS